MPRTEAGKRLDWDLDHFDHPNDGHEVSECIDAIEAEASTLDEERLARALTPHFGPSWFPGLTDVTIHGESPQTIARAIAKAYREDTDATD